MNIRIIVAEDNDVLLEDLCQELNGQPDFQVVATTPAGRGGGSGVGNGIRRYPAGDRMETIQAGIDAVPPFTRRSLRRRSSTSPPTTTMT
ncbi:hypothetical protein [Ruthenibacterium lactatiformans]|uniref:hypothetical protein n=1 Tax=Ruthenibacterium lactatiformans TaxID=1550024 RepID=UPI0039A00167